MISCSTLLPSWRSLRFRYIGACSCVALWSSRHIFEPNEITSFPQCDVHFLRNSYHDTHGRHTPPSSACHCCELHFVVPCVDEKVRHLRGLSTPSSGCCSPTASSRLRAAFLRRSITAVRSLTLTMVSLVFDIERVCLVRQRLDDDLHVTTQAIRAWCNSACSGCSGCTAFPFGDSVVSSTRISGLSPHPEAPRPPLPCSAAPPKQRSLILV